MWKLAKSNGYNFIECQAELKNQTFQIPLIFVSTILNSQMLTIRQATESDFETIYNFINTLENTVFDKAIQQKIFSENLKNENIIYLLAFDDVEPAGYISCHVQWLLHHAALIGEIQEMIVSEKFRSKGLGKLLMAELIKIAKSKGIDQLEVTSSKRREDAHRFYIREGFAQSHFKFTRNI